MCIHTHYLYVYIYAISNHSLPLGPLLFHKTSLKIQNDFYSVMGSQGLIIIIQIRTLFISNQFIDHKGSFHVQRLKFQGGYKTGIVPHQMILPVNEHTA